MQEIVVTVTKNKIIRLVIKYNKSVNDGNVQTKHLVGRTETSLRTGKYGWQINNFLF